MDLKPGEMWWARPDATVGREQAGRRPVVIVSGRLYLEAVTTLALAAPVTTTDRGRPNHVPIRGSIELPTASYAMTEQVRAVSRARIDTLIGIVSPECLDEIRVWIHDYITD